MLLALAYGALSLAWVLGNPVGLAPDEPGHYLKSLAVGGGRPAGRPVPAPPPGVPKKEAWSQRTTRAVDVPAGLSPEGLDCNVGRSHESAACQHRASPPQVRTTGRTYIGTHQPTTYLVPGVLGRLADDPVGAIQLGRLAGALVCVGFIAVALALLWDRRVGALSVAGLLAAVTPMVVFLASSLTASGPEVAAGICFFAALLRVTRSPAPAPWAWVALGVSGSLLATSRTLGPLWVVLDVAVVASVTGLRESGLVVRAAGRRAVLCLGAVALAMVLSVAWEVAVQPHGSLDITALKEAVRPSVETLQPVLGELIGVFGALDSLMPAVAYLLWWLALAVVLVAALRVGTRRERTVLAGLVAGVVGLCLLVAVVNLAQTGYGMQGRYVLPVAVVVPLLAGEVLARARSRPGRVPPQWLVVPVALVAGGVQAVGWYANARRSAVGTDGAWLFIGSAEWSPRSGWYPLAAVVALAVLLVLLFLVASLRRTGGAIPDVEPG